MSEPRLRLRKLVIHKFGDLLGPTELEFADGMNVVIGENGGGKSTLLRLIVELIHPQGHLLRQHGVDVEVSLAIAATNLYFRLLVERGGDGGKPAPWSVTGHVETGGVMHEWSWGSDRALKGTAVEFRQPASAEPPAFPTWSWVIAGHPASGDALLRALVAAVSVVRMDEADRAFDELRGEFVEVGAHVTSFLSLGARGFQRDSWPLSPAAGALDEQRWSSTEEPWLLRLSKALRAKDVVVKPGPTTRRADGLETCVSADLRVEWPDGSRGPAVSELSFGQKRLLALFWQLNVNKAAPLISDELVNGFHHSWVGPVLDEIGDRQSIVAVQNPLLLDELSFDSADDARRAITLCRMKTLENGRRQWIWEKPSMEQAECLFEAWGHGMSYVSELLKREGLW